MKTWLRVNTMHRDNPPGASYRWRVLTAEWLEWSPREEADFVHW